MCVSDLIWFHLKRLAELFLSIVSNNDNHLKLLIKKFTLMDRIFRLFVDG